MIQSIYRTLEEKVLMSGVFGFWTNLIIKQVTMWQTKTNNVEHFFKYLITHNYLLIGKISKTG